MRNLILCAVLLAAPVSAQTPATPPETTPVYRDADMAQLTGRHTRSFGYDETGLSGPGADFIREKTASAQFVLLGEGHHEGETPRFSLGLYRLLAQAHGYDRFVLELDPFAVEAINRAQGDLDQVSALARRYPRHIGFASDADLRMYAAVAKASTPAASILWGIEQAQGADWYLDELARLAPTEVLRMRALALRDEAAVKDFPARLGFIHDDPTTTPRLEALLADWSPAEGSPEHRLLTDLILSSRIYGYNRTANEGRPTALLNNTQREALFRTNFWRHYQKEAERRPRALFKMGSWHMWRGRSPAGAFTVANMAHELAAMNGMTAYGIDVYALGGHVADMAALPGWMQPILPADAPTSAVVIDVQRLHPYAQWLARLLPDSEKAKLVDYILAHDALVLLPNNTKATWDLTGFPPR